MKRRPLRVPVLSAAGGLLGGGSLLGLAGFLFHGSFEVMGLGFGMWESLAWDGALALAFSVQHSLMVRKPVRRILRGFLPRETFRPFFSLVSGVLLLLLLLLWQRAPVEPVSVEEPWRWCFRAAYLLAVVGFVWTAGSLRGLDPLGLRPLLERIPRGDGQPARLMVRGPYRWVRHPMYLFTLVLLWSCPDLTADRLLLNLLWSGWIVLATRLEERDLEAVFQDDYRWYRRVVPMLLPTRARPVDERVVARRTD